MRCRVIKSFNRRGEIQIPGSMIEVPENMLHQLAEYIQTMTPTTRDPKKFLHYCHPGNCHCSAKLPGANYPSGCFSIACEYYQASQDNPQNKND